MATIMLEGFDKYGPINASTPTVLTLMQQEWSSVGGSTQITTSLNGAGGYAILNPGNTTAINKTFGTTYGRWIGGIRIQPTVSGSNLSPIFTIANGGNSMCALWVNNAGTFTFARGNQTSGTAIATSSVTVRNGSTHYVEWDITFGAASPYTIYLDGVSMMTSGSANTGNGQTVANKIFLGSDGSNNTVQMILDDFYLFDNTGSFANAAALTNPRIETRYPTGDSQTQWTNGGNVVIPTGITQTSVEELTASVNAPGANQLALLKVIPRITCNLQSVALQPSTTSAGAKFKAVLYTDSAGTPNTVVATGTEVVGVTSGTTLVLPFGAGQTLTGGTTYWIGFIGDTVVTIFEYDSTTVLGQKAANTYTLGAPATAPAMTSGQATWLIWGNATGAAANWASVSQNAAPGTGPEADSGSINSSTVNNEDLYSFPALAGTATTVYSVGVKANCKKDAGTRTIDLRLKSSATDSAGSTAGQTPGATYGWLDSYFDADPNGTIAWTTAALNAATAGPKVAS